MRELQLGWNIIGFMLVLDWLMGQPARPVWPGFFILVGASIGIAVLWEMPRRAAIRKLKTEIELEGGRGFRSDRADMSC